MNHPVRSSRRQDLHAGTWLKRVLVQLARQAERDLSMLADHEERTIHRLRKRMKKLRALLQFARPVLDEPFFDSFCTQVRKLKNAFGSRRDAHVMAELRKTLGEEAGVRDKSLPPLRGPTMERAAAMASALTAELRKLKLAKLTWAHVEESYTKSYKQARRAWQEATGTAEAETLHQWRKRVKRLYYQSVSLTRWLDHPKRLRRTRKLGSLLGDCHDLDVFQELVQTGKLPGPEGWDEQVEAERGKLLPRISRRAEKLFKRSGSKVAQQCRKALPA